MRRATLAGLAALAIASTAIGIASLNPVSFVGVARADSASAAPGLALPAMNPQRGRALFASKGCVVCHSINGVGGLDAAPLDASTMDPAMNPFEFFARMLAVMTPMVAMQEDRLGQQVELSAEELGDLVAFIHDSDSQKTFSEDEIPEDIEHLMED